MKKIFFLIAFLICSLGFSQTTVSAPETTDVDSILVLTPNRKVNHVKYTTILSKLSSDLNIVGGGITNLTTSQTPTTVTINSDTGTDATIPLGNGTNAGVSINNYTTSEKSLVASAIQPAGLSPYLTSALASSTYEPIFSKNTGFNKNFGTTAGTVAEGNDSRIVNALQSETNNLSTSVTWANVPIANIPTGTTGSTVALGNHAHTFASLTSKPTTIGGYGITDFNSLGDARWSLTSHTQALSTITQSGATTNQVPQWNGSAWIPATISGGGSISDAIYDGTWNGDTTVGASKNAIYDKIESVIAGSGASASKEVKSDWNGVITTWVVTVTPGTNHTIQINNVMLVEGVGKDYTISGNTITFATAPLTGETAIYRPNVVVPVVGGSGTVTDVSIVTANGVTGSVATSTTTPAITLSLGAITPTTIVASGAISGSNLSGNNSGDQDLSGYATLASTQTFTREKTFNSTTDTNNIVVTRTTSGNGIFATNSGTGDGIRSHTTALGNAFYARTDGGGKNYFSYLLDSSGDGFYADASATATGFNFIGKNNGTTTFSVNKLGNISATSFVKSGGTSSQFLKADGSVDSNIYASTSALNTWTASNTFNPSSGVGILINKNTNQYGLNVASGTGGSGIFTQSAGTANNITSNQTSLGTGFNYIGQNDSVNTFTVNKLGEVTATKFNLGGDGLSYMKNDGTVALISSLGSPAIATTSEINTGTDNAKMVTSLGLNTSKYFKKVNSEISNSFTVLGSAPSLNDGVMLESSASGVLYYLPLGSMPFYRAGNFIAGTNYLAPNGSAASLTGLPLTTGVTGLLPVANGGTGRATGTTAYSLIATGTTATGAQQTLANGLTTQLLVGGGASALPVWTTATGTGSPVRATSPTLVTPNLGTPSVLTLTNATGLPTAGIVDGAVTTSKLASGIVPTSSANNSTIALNNVGGERFVASANSATNYVVTITGSKVGAWSKTWINTTTQPTVNGVAITQPGATWVTGTNMYLVCYTDNGTTIESYLLLK